MTSAPSGEATLPRIPLALNERPPRAETVPPIRG